MRLLLATAGATLAFAGWAGTVSAAYAPQLQVTLDPTTFAKAPAVTSVITQAPGETASKTVKVTFPKGFEPNLGARPSICPPEGEQANNCPPESQIGTAEATASVIAVPFQLTGTVHYGGPAGVGTFKLIVFLRNDVLGTQRIIGTARLLPAGGSEVVFDGLPDVLTTSFKLALQGGDRALLKNPSTCGEYVIAAAFTSQQGEQAAAQQPVTIEGCPPPRLAVSAVRLHRSGQVSFRVSAPASGTVTLRRKGRRVAARDFSAAAAGVVGVATKRLRKRRYRVLIAARTEDGREAALRVRRLARRG